MDTPNNFQQKLRRELREQFLQKIIDEKDDTFKGYDSLTDAIENDDFSMLHPKFDKFANDLLDDMESVLILIYPNIKKVTERKKVFISIENLKRILADKNSYEVSWIPKTKNCLAIYIGYNSWEDFVSKVSPSLQPKPTIINQKIIINPFFFIPPTRKKGGLLGSTITDETGFVSYEEIEAFSIPYKKIIVWLSGMIIFLSLAYYFYHWITNRPFTKEQLSKVKFEFVTQYDKPNTSTLRIAYDVSSLGVDSAQIDYGNDEFYLSGTERIAKNLTHIETYKTLKDTISHTFFKPNVWVINLVVNGQVIRSLTKIVYSGNEWTSWARGRENRTFWVGKNVFSNTTMKKGVLHYRKEDMEKQGGLDYFYTTHQINQKFNIYGDSTLLELKIKNSEIDGGFLNYDTSISFLDSTRNYALVNLIQDSIEYGNITFAKTSVSGKKNYLPFLDINLQDWRLFKILLKDKKARIYIDNKLIFEKQYEGSISYLRGFRITFKGSGSVDWVRLTNSHTGKVIFFDDFIR